MGSRFFTTVLIISFILTAPMPVLTRHVFAQTAEQLKGNLDALSIQIKALDDEIKAYNSKINQTQGQYALLRVCLVLL